MDSLEKAWLGLWTLIAYAPAAFARLRELPLEAAVTREQLSMTRLGPDAVARVEAAVGSEPEGQLARIGQSAIDRLGPDGFVVAEAGIPGAECVGGRPPWFWGIGDRALLDAGVEGAVCVVGSRRTDAAGSRMARQIAGALARDGWRVVSGGALGIDAVAHSAALDAGGRTVAVLPSGLDVPCPRRNLRLFDRIVREGGLLLSPFPPGHNPKRWHFARRNVVMAAMTGATIVVRASPRSGSMLTARAARSLGRRVLAVPGDAWRTDLRGTSELLAEGAEVLADPSAPGLGLPGDRESHEGAPRALQPQRSPEGGRIIDALRHGPLHRDDLAAALRTPLYTLHGTLLELELSGDLRQDVGGIYALTTRGAAV